MQNTNAVLAVITIFFMTLCGSALAADNPAALADFDKLQEQVRSIDKDIAVLKEGTQKNFEALKDRQNEITTQQANSLSAIANQTTTVSNYIANTSIAIAVLLVIAGLATYIGVTKKVEEEARKASRRWFEENAAKLKDQFSLLQGEVASASVAIKAHRTRVKSDADAASVDIADNVKQARAVIIEASKSSAKSDSASNTNQEAVTIIREASEALKAKPEDAFTADDFYARGLADYTNRNYQSALLAFENALQALGKDAPSQQSAQYLSAKAGTLSVLNKPEQAIAVYDDIDQRFGKDTAPGVRELVANGLVSKGYRLEVLEKPQQAIAVYDYVDKRFGKDTSTTVREQVASGLVNKGFALSQLNNPEQAIAVYDDIDHRFGKDTGPGVLQQVATALVNKGVVLGKLDKPEQAIAVYDDIDQRFGKNDAPRVRHQVARALAGKSANQITRDKKQWAVTPPTEESMANAASDLQRALQLCDESDRSRILGTLGYVQFLMQRFHNAEKSTKECLRLGGQELWDALLAANKLLRLEPQDSEYEKMLADIWKIIQTESVKSKK